jgi:predicted ATPase
MEKGHVESLKRKKESEDPAKEKRYTGFIDINWENIPMLSVLTGENGIGKSSLLKMMLLYVNRKPKTVKDSATNIETGSTISNIKIRSLIILNFIIDFIKNLFGREKTLYNTDPLPYDICLKSNLKMEDINIELIHFDNNSRDLRNRDYTKPSYPKERKAKPTNETHNFSKNLSYLHQNLFEKTMIQGNEIQNLRKALENTGIESDFNKLKKSQKNIEWKDCFPQMDEINGHNQRFKILKQILNLKKNNIKNYINNFNLNILSDNLDKLDEINKELETKNFGYLIDISLNFKISSKFLFWKSSRIYLDLVFISNPKNSSMLNKKKRIEIETLTNGEQIILLSILWNFIINKGIKPAKHQVLLLDEPDAHMHPSAVKGLVESVFNLVDQGIQIIITTHNPTTVSFFKEENLFLLCKNNDKLEIKHGLSQQSVIFNLTSNLVMVNSPKKTLFVEGQDANFYKKMEQIILKNFPIYKIPFHFYLNIMPLKKKLQNKSMLKQTMKALQDCPGFFGIIDDDSDSDCGISEFVPNLFHLERYAKENYVLDPVNVFFFLKQVIRNNKGKENQVIKNNKEKKNQVTRNNKGKNEKIEDLINKIEESIMNNIGEGYKNNDLIIYLD